MLFRSFEDELGEARVEDGGVEERDTGVATGEADYRFGRDASGFEDVEGADDVGHSHAGDRAADHVLDDRVARQRGCRRGHDAVGDVAVVQRIGVAVAVLQRISQSVDAIRTSLHLQREDFDRNAASDLAASIAHLTEQLEQATRQWLTDDPQSFGPACRQEMATLATQSAAIQNDLLRGVPVAQLRREIDDTYEHWRVAYKYLVKCQTEDRPILGRLSCRLTPALVELRTMISQSTIAPEAIAARSIRSCSARSRRAAFASSIMARAAAAPICCQSSFPCPEIGRAHV